MKPKHQVVTRSPQRSVGLVACSWLQAKPIEHDSQLERRFIQRMLVTPGVIEIIAQPFRIIYGENNDRSYTPDFLIRFINKQSLVVEVKPQKYVKEFATTFDLVTPILDEKQMSFHVVTDKMVDIEDIPADVELLLRYARSNVSTEAIASVMRHFKDPASALSIADLTELMAGDTSTIYHMLGRKLLIFKNDISLTANTQIQIIFSEDKNDNVCIPDWLNAAAWNTDTRVRSEVGQQPDSVRRPHHTPVLCMADRQSRKRNPGAKT